MSPELQALLEKLPEDGTPVTYTEIFEATPFEQRHRLPHAQKEGKKMGVLKINVGFENGALSHTLNRVV
jgi:hypothetical protein